MKKIINNWKKKINNWKRRNKDEIDYWKTFFKYWIASEEERYTLKVWRFWILEYYNNFNKNKIFENVKNFFTIYKTLNYDSILFFKIRQMENRLTKNILLDIKEFFNFIKKYFDFYLIFSMFLISEWIKNVEFKAYNIINRVIANTPNFLYNLVFGLFLIYTFILHFPIFIYIFFYSLFVEVFVPDLVDHHDIWLKKWKDIFLKDIEKL